MNKIVYIVIAVATLIVLAVTAEFTDDMAAKMGMLNGANDGAGSLEAELKLVRQEVKPMLPMQIDEGVTFTDIDTMEDKIIYTFSIAKGIEEIDLSRFKTEVANRLSASVCQEEETLTLLAIGARLAFIYEDNDNNVIGTFNFDRSTCA